MPPGSLPRRRRAAHRRLPSEPWPRDGALPESERPARPRRGWRPPGADPRFARCAASRSLGTKAARREPSIRPARNPSASEVSYRISTEAERAFPDELCTPTRVQRSYSSVTRAWQSDVTVRLILETQRKLQWWRAEWMLPPLAHLRSSNLPWRRKCFRRSRWCLL